MDDAHSDRTVTPAPRAKKRGCGFIGLTIALTLVSLLIIAPLLWPVPPLENTTPPVSLADGDSRFAMVGDLGVHFKEAGSTDATQTLILMHGFGASTFSWRDQLELLGEEYRVIAFDRPAFGLTERPLPGDFRPEENPYSAQANADQVIGLMDALNVEHAVLVAHSAGGAVAVLSFVRALR